MYLRVVRILIVLTAIAIVAAVLFPPRRPTASPVTTHSNDDTRLNRRLSHVAFDGVPLRSAVQSLNAMGGLNLATESLPEKTWTAQVKFDLHDVSVEQLIRVLFDGCRMEDSEGDAIVRFDERDAVDPVYCFDVRGLVSPPARAVVAVSPPNPTMMMGPDWYGVDGVHPSPIGKALPEPSETQVLVDRLKHAHLLVSNYHPEFTAELPGRLLLNCTPHEKRVIDNALHEIRHPIALDTPPQSLLDQRISRFEASGTIASALNQLGRMTGVNIVVRSQTSSPPPIDMNVPVSVSLTDTTLGEALASVFAESKGTFAVEDNNLIIAGNEVWEADGAEFHAYDVRKILAAPINLKVDQDPDLPPDDPDPIAAMPDRESMLLALIARHIGQVDFEYDNEAGIQIWQGKLLLSAQHEYHRRLWKYLHDLAHAPVQQQPTR